MLGWLLAGAIVSVAVAWGCALWVPTGITTSVDYGVGVQPRLITGIPIDAHVVVSTREKIGQHEKSIEWYVPGESRHVLVESNIIWYFETGWPFPAQYTQMNQDGVVTGGLTPPDWLHPRVHKFLNRPLPLMPIWPGILANTLFYTILFWLLAHGTFALRRHFRRMRGLCVKCACDLKGVEHVACPECGNTTIMGWHDRVIDRLFGLRQLVNKKSISKTMIFVFAGFVCNLIIAWILALSVNVSSWRDDGLRGWINYDRFENGVWLLPGRYGDWHVEVYRRWGSMQVHSFQHSIDACDAEYLDYFPAEIYTHILGFDDPVELSKTHSSLRNVDVAASKRIYEARGWPMLSFSCVVQDAQYTFGRQFTDHLSQKQFTWDTGIVIGSLKWPYKGTHYDVGNIMTLPKVLPIRPVIVGCIVNTMLYGLFLAAAWKLMRYCRKSYLLRHMRCCNCGYALIGLASKECPECGTPIERAHSA